MAPKFCAGYARQPCACANANAKDTASVANFQSVYISHVALDLNVSFEKKQLQGYAELRLRLPDDAPPVANVNVSLDVHRELKVSRVEQRQAGSPEAIQLPFKVEEFTHFGEALRFTLPREAFAMNGDEDPACHEAVIRIDYETTPLSPATTWLSPEQTHGKDKPYLFTQGQACLNRALFPCMDTPAVRFTYEATIRVPVGFTAVMSAERCGEQSGTVDGFEVVCFRMPQPIPSYLVALAVGNLASRDIGPRSKVWSEITQLEAAAAEFDSMPEQYLSAGEQLFGPYRWGTYDIVVMPPSFPFGGMENPRMTFVTSCLLTGDRSLGDVIAHEIAHSWFGNLVTNATWSEFWLNEGFTMFAQRRITDVVHGKAFTALEAMTGRKILEDDVAAFGKDHVLTQLRCPIEAGVDPEDTYNECPYEKGFAMVSYLRHIVGSDESFDAWLGRYAERFAFTSIVAEDMFGFFFESYPELKDQVDVDTWLYKPGMPTWLPDLSVGEVLIEPVEDLLASWKRAGEEGDSSQFESLLQKTVVTDDWVTYQRLHFLDRLLEISDGIPVDIVDKLGVSYKFLASHNAEIQLRFGLIIARKRLAARYDYIGDFLRAQGKQKYTLPLYKAMVKHKGSAAVSLEWDFIKLAWTATKDCLHPNVRRAVQQACAAEGLNLEQS